MARLLITGSSGYIGSYLAKHFSQEGHEVTAAARKLSPQLSAALPGCTPLELDVCLPTGAITGSWDCIVHTATANDIVSKDAKAGIELSVLGTLGVLDIAKRLGVGHVIFFSTLQVYGQELSGHISEKRDVDIVNSYALNHYFGEFACGLFGRLNGIRTSIVRPSNVYGCPVSNTVGRWTLVPLCFVLEVMRTGTVTIRSSGLQKRDFVSLQQLGSGCATLIGETPASSGTFNIAAGRTLRILDIAKWVVEVYRERTGLSARLVVAGGLPATSNEFDVESSLVPMVSEADLEASMKATIVEIISFFKTRSDLLDGGPLQARR